MGSAADTDVRTAVPRPASATMSVQPDAPEEREVAHLGPPRAAHAVHDRQLHARGLQAALPARELDASRADLRS